MSPFLPRQQRAPDPISTMSSFRSPSPAWVLATALFVAACIALGYWQLGRARQKQELIDEYTRGHATTIEITSRSLDGLARYQTVSAHGRYEAHRQVLLDNMPSADGHPGYRVITPFRRAGAHRLLLIDRGWLPLGVSRERLPAVDVADTARDIVGRIDHPPAPGLRLHPGEETRDATWPRVMNFPTTDELSAALGEPVEPLIVLLDPQATDGYDRRWQPASGRGPARHVAYAVQWFAFAIVAAIVLVVVSVRRGRARDRDT
jgi:surfeit locus 1 family protein